MIVEHVSLTVRDIDAETEFLCTAFPDFRVRGGGEMDHGSWRQRWSHVGNDTYYMALYQAMPGASRPPKAHSFAPGANHIGVVVEDAGEVKQRLLAAGYREGFVPEPHPYRRRVYFIDPEGFQWEFVQYLSDKPEERNQY